MTPKTGPDAESGLSCERGAMLARDFLKQLGYDVEIVIADTESNPEAARRKAEKLVQEGVQCLVGAYNSAASATIAQVAELRKVPFIINLSAADNLTEQGYEYTFRNFPTSKMLARNSILSMKPLFENFKPKTGSLIVLNDAYGKTMLNAFNEYKAELPFDLVEVIQYDAKAKDLSTEIAKLKAVNADVLLIVSRLATTSQIMKELITQDFNPKAILSPGGQGFYEAQFYQTFGKNADNLYTLNAWSDPRSPLTQMAQSLFHKMYPDQLFEMNVAFSLEAIYVAALAHAQNHKNLKEALKTLNVKEGIIYGGPIQFDEKGQRQTIKSLSLMNQGNKPVIVSPAELAEAQAVFPFPGFKAA